MGPPGMPSLGGMLPITGLGAAAALCRTEEEEEHSGLAAEMKPFSRKEKTEDTLAGFLELTDGNTIIEWPREIVF